MPLYQFTIVEPERSTVSEVDFVDMKDALLHAVSLADLFAAARRVEVARASGELVLTLDLEFLNDAETIDG